MKILEQDQIKETIRVYDWKFSANYGIVSSPFDKNLILEPRLSKLLYFLGLNANSHVSRDYLVENIWTDTIVNKDSLTRAVADLRKVLSTHYNDSIEIETLRKRGYKLSLNVKKKTNRFKLRINPVIANTVLGLIFLIIVVWILADIFGVVETKLVNSSHP